MGRRVDTVAGIDTDEAGLGAADEVMESLLRGGGDGTLHFLLR